MPNASNVNFAVNQVVANRVTVGVGSYGRIEIYNHTGTVNVDLDVDGYYTGSGGTGSSVRADDPDPPYRHPSAHQWNTYRS